MPVPKEIRDWTVSRGPKGDQGIPGPQGERGNRSTRSKGEQGIAGAPGTDGRTPYLHIKYAPVKKSYIFATY